MAERQQRGDYEPEIQELLDKLPEPTVRPCTECPWLRSSTPGHLGPYTAEEWTELAHQDGPIACHMTIEGNDQEWTELRQCMGSAIFRANVHKTPRHPKVAVSEPDTALVFAWDDEMIAHHDED